MYLNNKEVLIERMQNSLKLLRIKLELSQAELASMVGISRFTVMAIESGKRKMTWNTFLSLILIFTKNKETNDMLSFFNIYTDELNDMLKLRENKKR